MTPEAIESLISGGKLSEGDWVSFTNDNDLKPWFQFAAERPELNRYRLCALRYISLWASSQGRGDVSPEAVADPGNSWLAFLLGPAAQGQSFFVQHDLTRTFPAFYAQQDHTSGRLLRPLKRAKWGEEWSGVLSWLKQPERLTIVEIEIALAIFEWKAETPELVWWLRDYPHILWRVHAYLLRNYGFKLARSLLKAMSKTSWADRALAKQPPFKAGVLSRFQPRIAGLIAIGSLGILSINHLLTLIFAAPWAWVGAAGVLLLGLLLLIVLMDVFKQNRGVLVSWVHAWPRACSVLWRALCWGAAGTAAVWGMFLAVGSSAINRTQLANWIWYHQLPDMAVPNLSSGPWWQWLVRLATLGLGAVFLGLLLQWFWEDRAVTEPI